MSVDTESVSEPGWEVDPDDEWGVAVITTVGRQLKLRREAVGMRAADFGKAVGYGEDMVYKIESGKRIPRPEFLDRADEVLSAGGLLAAMKEDVDRVRYPKKVRALVDLEGKAVELLSYGNHHVHGLLQTEEFMRALMGSQRPKLPQAELEQAVAGRLSRKKIFQRSPAPELSFVLEEVTLRRPIGGTSVLRRQLQHLLNMCQLPHVQIQVMPTDRWDHPGMGGRIQVLKFEDGTAVGRMDDGYGGRPVSEPRQLRILELRYGSIRAEALTPRESEAFIRQLLGET
ncbi:helix-turn-helix transcriptional regulator [Streptomyces sp. 5-8]|uniref:Helix-turn-helix transcriptional regulator n=1 Tax=Streptomyces musisoli TaxID=2802280 RepID=A0ABS1PD40_9ACTN|nr:helix-turn-helix transcriptional regulator [Streptomyces musisoli]MBL1110085.1 helix-turn-helix transcriptional regulator [Streptomyces musisoli]